MHLMHPDAPTLRLVDEASPQEIPGTRAASGAEAGWRRSSGLSGRSRDTRLAEAERRLEARAFSPFTGGSVLTVNRSQKLFSNPTGGRG